MRTDIKHKLKVAQTQGSSVFASQGSKLCEAPYVTFSLYYNVESYAKGVRCKEAARSARDVDLGGKLE